MEMVTYSDLFQLGILIVNIITLVVQINNHISVAVFQIIHPFFVCATLSADCLFCFLLLRLFLSLQFLSCNYNLHNMHKIRLQESEESPLKDQYDILFP